MKRIEKKKKLKNAYSALLLTLVVLTGLLWPLSAAAVDPIDPARPCSLQLHVAYAGSNIQGMTFHLYAVGTGDEATSFSLSGAFAGYPVSLTGLNASGWQAAAEDLADYAEADGIAPDVAGVTDAGGMIHFTGLSGGLYLIVGEDYISGYSLFQVSPFLVALPHLQDDGSWLYDVASYPKVSDPVTIPVGTPGPGIPTSTLPQTGWRWWPVPLMAVLGLVLFGIGWWRRYHDGKETEK